MTYVKINGNWFKEVQFKEEYSKEEKLYLKYYEAKSSGFDYDNLNETLQYEYFKDNEDLLAKKWENYAKFKKELYGL